MCGGEEKKRLHTRECTLSFFLTCYDIFMQVMQISIDYFME